MEHAARRCMRVRAELGSCNINIDPLLLFRVHVPVVVLVHVLVPVVRTILYCKLKSQYSTVFCTKRAVIKTTQLYFQLFSTLKLILKLYERSA